MILDVVKQELKSIINQETFICYPALRIDKRNSFIIPRSNYPVRKLPAPGNSGDFVEAVFRPGNFRIFSDDFRPVPAEKHRKLTGIHRKKSGQFEVGILLLCSSDFRCFPAGSGDFPESFLRDPVAGIVDLGSILVESTFLCVVFIGQLNSRFKESWKSRES